MATQKRRWGRERMTLASQGYWFTSNILMTFSSDVCLFATCLVEYTNDTGRTYYTLLVGDDVANFSV